MHPFHLSAASLVGLGNFSLDRTAASSDCAQVGSAWRFDDVRAGRTNQAKNKEGQVAGRPTCFGWKNWGVEGDMFFPAHAKYAQGAGSSWTLRPAPPPASSIFASSPEAPGA